MRSSLIIITFIYYFFQRYSSTNSIKFIK
jgi:hypothetical protein